MGKSICKVWVNGASFSFQAESDITAYTYERTLMMEQRTEMLKSMRVAKMQPQAIIDNIHAAANDVKDVRIKLDTVSEELESSTDDVGLERNQYTFTPSGSGGVTMEKMAESINKNVLDLKP